MLCFLDILLTILKNIPGGLRGCVTVPHINPFMFLSGSPKEHGVGGGMGTLAMASMGRRGSCFQWRLTPVFSFCQEAGFFLISTFGVTAPQTLPFPKHHFAFPFGGRASYLDPIHMGALRHTWPSLGFNLGTNIILGGYLNKDIKERGGLFSEINGIG